MGEVLIVANCGSPRNRDRNVKSPNRNPRPRPVLLKNILHRNDYGELATKMVEQGRVEDFLMIVETVVASDSDMTNRLVCSGICNIISRGSLHSLTHVLHRIHKLGIIPNKSLLSSQCRRLLKARRLKELVAFLETLAGLSFSIEEFAKPCEILKLCFQQTDPETAVRYVYLLPQAPSLFSSIILEFGKRGDLKSAIRAYEAAKCKSIGPNMYVCRTMIDVCGLCDDFLQSRYIYEDLLAQNVIPNTYVFNSLMNVNAQDLGYTLQIYQHMKALKVMRDNGVEPDVIAYTTAIRACVRNKSIKLAFSLFEEMKSYRVKPNLVTYNTLLRARRRYGSLHEVQQCLATYQDMRKAGYSPNDYFLKELIEEWCEGVITDANHNEGIVYRPDSHDKTDRETPQNMLLEKIAAHLQRDISQNMVLDLRGLTKVEARIIVLAVLRKIKENYSIGDTLEDDIIIILGVRKDGDGHKFEVQNAVVKLLRDELGLCVLFSRPMISLDIDADLLGKKAVSKSVFHINIESSARRPIILRRLKVTKKSLYHWLQKRVGINSR